ncbi:hypothetical protein D5952_14120 [Salmonella enterica subsp. enterica]|nr:hypothetical protein [Salmonella enterica subsp. enterica serovar Bonn]MLZ41060.1 hypothetical protein [Salmonella enterica subsp. enterica serovar Bonn]
MKCIGLGKVIISDEMAFTLSRHDLYINAVGQKITFMLVSKRQHKPVDVKLLATKVSPERFNGKISRVFLLDSSLAVHFCTDDDAQAEDMYDYYLKLSRFI